MSSNLEIIEGCIQLLPDNYHPAFRLNVLLNRKPEFRYVRLQANLYVAHDGPLLDSYSHSPGSKNGFAGRGITLAMKNGEDKTFPPGEMWSSGQAAAAYFFGLGDFISVGYRAIDDDYLPGLYYGSYLAVETVLPLLNAVEARHDFYSPRATILKEWEVYVSPEQQSIIEA